MEKRRTIHLLRPDYTALHRHCLAGPSIGQFPRFGRQHFENFFQIRQLFLFFYQVNVIYDQNIGFGQVDTAFGGNVQQQVRRTDDDIGFVVDVFVTVLNCCLVDFVIFVKNGQAAALVKCQWSGRNL